ncbi:MAG: hypothetical protein QOF63_2426 [Thermoanaerobaculia bacterium]|jgi:hypothetical protein|nr:hypothetical protein [Thermoanaerobaculia bacterium]
MPVPIGVFIKSARKLIVYGVNSKKISKRIKKLEAEEARPLLSSFSGVERFDAAHRLLDAALIQRLRTSADPERPEIIEQYLTRSHEEYAMARENLAAVPATRADIAALGLALKELTLTFDRELAAFREGSATELTRITDRAQAELRESSESRFAELSKRVSNAVAADATAREEILALLKLQKEDPTAVLDRVRTEMATQIETLSASLDDAHAEQERAVSASFARVDGRLAKNQAAITSHRDEISASLVRVDVGLAENHAALTSHRDEVSASFARVDGRLAKNQAALTSHRDEVSASFAHVDGRLAENEAALTSHRDEVSASFTGVGTRLTANETALTSHRAEVVGDLARITAAHRATTVRLQWMLAGSFLLTVFALIIAWPHSWGG